MTIENSDNNFELSFRFLGNEVFAIKLETTSKTNKWLAASVLICGLAIWALYGFGPVIVDMLTTSGTI